MTTAIKKTKLEGVTILLSKEKSEELFHSALCNGIQIFHQYGLELDYKDVEYKKAYKSLEAKINKGEIPIGMIVFSGEKPTICREDAWMEMLRLGYELKVVDNENDGEYNRSIKLADVNNRVQETPLNHLADEINEDGDAITADVILQTVFFQDVVFG